MLQTELNAALATYGSIAGKTDMVLGANAGTVAVTPDLFSTHYRFAITRCDVVITKQAFGDLTACQLLANMCVMAMYDMSHATCKAYQTMVAQPNRTSIQPYPYDGQ